MLQLRFSLKGSPVFCTLIVERENCPSDKPESEVFYSRKSFHVIHCTVHGKDVVLYSVCDCLPLHDSTSKVMI